MILRPFFTFFGGKWRLAAHLPAPTCGSIIEPFAGSAGYSLRHPQLNVTLVERDPVIAETWRYILTASVREVRKLPLYGDGWRTTDELHVPLGARHLIGFWLNKAMTSPCKTPSAWMRSNIRPNSQWGEAVRERIASQLEMVRHWRLIEGDYSTSPDVRATWFIDPPYRATGHRYRFSSRLIDYAALAQFCRSRRGLAMACEHVGADWLPFEPFMVSKSTEGFRRDGRSKEALWLGGIS